MPAGTGVSPAYATCMRAALCEPQAAAANAPDATTAVRRSACRMGPIVTLSDRGVKRPGIWLDLGQQERLDGERVVVGHSCFTVGASPQPRAFRSRTATPAGPV